MKKIQKEREEAAKNLVLRGRSYGGKRNRFGLYPSDEEVELRDEDSSDDETTTTRIKERLK